MRYMMRIVRRFGRRDEGQALVEFALITPFLLVFLVGIIEFGRAWNAHQVVTDAAREGARKAAVFDEAGIITEDTIRSVIKHALTSAHLDTSSTVITLYNWDGPTNDTLTVLVQQPYFFLFFGELKQWTTGERTITLASRFTMRNE